MAQGNGLYSPSLITKETNSIQTSLPFDLIPEILSRLPVKVLLRFLCVCKSWKSLISDRKFTEKHLSLSTRHTLHSFEKKERYYNGYINVMSYSFDSLFNNFITTDISKVCCCWKTDDVDFVGSCNGILCFADRRLDHSIHIQLWNPSITKFKKLPHLLQIPSHLRSVYGFGYDLISDNYKIVVLPIYGKEMKIHTLGTNSWKTIPNPMFPSDGVERGIGFQVSGQGQYVSGATNWLVVNYKSIDFKNPQYFIASFDLRNETYQEILLPNYGVVELNLSVFKDCLCIIAGANIWVMKEFGNKESLTKLFTISHLCNSFTPSSSSFDLYLRALYDFDDGQVLLQSARDPPLTYIFYNLKNDTSKFIRFENIIEFCVESLISPGI